MVETKVPAVRGGLIARNAALNLATLLIPLVVAVITLPLMIAGLGTERFGFLSVAWLLLTYLSELGFGTATTYYSAAAIGGGRSDELNAVAWTATALQAAVGLAMGIVLAAATPLLVDHVLKIPASITNEARLSLYLLAASLPLLGFARSFRGLIEAAQRFDLTMVVQLPITIGSYVLAAVAAQTGGSLPIVMLVIVAARLIAVPAYYVAARRALPGLSMRPILQTERLRDMAKFAGWSAISTVVSPLLMYLDRFMIGVLLSLTAVTFYAAPYELVARLTLIPGAVAGALFPALSQLNAQRDRERSEQLAMRCLAVLLALLAPIVVFVLGTASDVLTIWLGADYAAQSALAMQILAIGVLVNAIAHVPYILLHSIRRPDLPARFHLLELPIQAVLAWILISRFGITGAAIAWTLRMLIDAALLFTAAARTEVLRRRSFFAHVMPAAVLGLVGAGIVAVVVATRVPSPVVRVLVTVVLTIASAALLWRVAISANERRRITGLFRPAT